MRLLLDGEIDGTKTLLDTIATKRAGYDEHIAQIDTALLQEESERARLPAQGEVLTLQDVQGARQWRENGWRLIRAQCEGKLTAEMTAQLASYAGEHSASDVYESDVARANALIDALAKDMQRAADLQASNNKTAALMRDRDALVEENKKLDTEEESVRRKWKTALREWQKALEEARQVAESIYQLEDELRGAAREKKLQAMLHKALLAAGAQIDDDALLSQLMGLATSLKDDFARRETAISTAAGAARQRQEQRALQEQTERELQDTVIRAKEAVRRATSDLMLVDVATPDEAIVRLDAFDQLVALHAQLTEQKSRCKKVEKNLLSLKLLAQAIAGAGATPSWTIWHAMALP